MCDRKTGNCKCFDGYKGDNCGNIACQSDCSNHGVCTSLANAVYVMDSNYPHYEHSSTKNPSADKNTFVCVCDGDYTGTDCSESIFFIFYY